MENIKISPKVKFELLSSEVMASIKGSRSGVYQKENIGSENKAKKSLWDYIWDLF